MSAPAPAPAAPITKAPTPTPVVAPVPKKAAAPAPSSSKSPVPPAQTTKAAVAATKSPAKKPTKEELLPHTLKHIAKSLPLVELETIVAETQQCEAHLEKEIQQLEEALKDPSKHESAVNIMLASEITPLDRHFTLSALIGRLRAPMAPALPPNSSIQLIRQQQLQKKMASKKGNRAASPFLVAPDAHVYWEQQLRMQQLRTHPNYRRVHADPSQLLACFKRISSHRTAAVFRRPVNPKEAPGYAERILFPMDLSLVKKLIAASHHIQSYEQLHEKIGIICHNCVKYNGRESDYGVVAREFEGVADEIILQTVLGKS